MAEQLIIGRHPVVEALRAGRPLQTIYLQRHVGGELIREILQLARQQQVPVKQVPAEKLQKFSRANHQGCIAIASAVAYYDLQAVISHIVEAGQQPLLVMAVGITDVRNLGAIARSAFCLGAQALILPEKDTAPINELAVKTAAGALDHLMVARVSGWKQAYEVLKLNGIHIVATGVHNGLTPDRIDWNQPIALVLGSEDTGLPKPCMEQADAVVTIPIHPDFDSLNVSVAAGVLLYQAAMQRHTFHK